MIRVENHSFGEQRLKQVIGEGTPLVEAYPNIPAEVIIQLREKAIEMGILKVAKKKTKKKFIIQLREKAIEMGLLKVAKKKTKKKVKHD